MTRFRNGPAAVALVCALAACKIEDTRPTAEAEDGAPQSEADRVSQVVEDSWDSEVLPLVETRAVPVPELRAALGTGIETAGEAHGLRPDGEANSWNFIVTGTGTAVEANLESRAATMTLDTDGDGAGDVELMLGPVMRGTAIRDAMPFFTFTDFRDQIEFAQLGRALNERAATGFTPPAEDPTGQEFTFTAIMTLQDAGAEWSGVPVALEPSR